VTGFTGARLSGLGPPGFAITQHPGAGALVARPLYLAELATRAATLDAQADALANFIDDSRRFLAEHPPP
jgi:hypothetical protein